MFTVQVETGQLSFQTMQERGIEIYIDREGRENIIAYHYMFTVQVETGQLSFQTMQERHSLFQAKFYSNILKEVISIHSIYLVKQLLLLKRISCCS